MGLHRAARHLGKLLSGSEETHPEVHAIPEDRPVESQARGSNTGSYLLGGVLAVLLVLRFMFGLP